MVELHILEARDLTAGKLGAGLDPYVRVTLRSKKTHAVLMRKVGEGEQPRFQEETQVQTDPGNREQARKPGKNTRNPPLCTM